MQEVDYRVRDSGVDSFLLSPVLLADAMVGSGE